MYSRFGLTFRSFDWGLYNSPILSNYLVAYSYKRVNLTILAIVVAAISIFLALKGLIILPEFLVGDLVFYIVWRFMDAVYFWTLNFIYVILLITGSWAFYFLNMVAPANLNIYSILSKHFVDDFYQKFGIDLFYLIPRKFGSFEGLEEMYFFNSQYFKNNLTPLFTNTSSCDYNTVRTIFNLTYVFIPTNINPTLSNYPNPYNPLPALPKAIGGVGSYPTSSRLFSIDSLTPSTWVKELTQFNSTLESNPSGVLRSLFTDFLTSLKSNRWLQSNLTVNLSDFSSAHNSLYGISNLTTLNLPKLGGGLFYDTAPLLTNNTPQQPSLRNQLMFSTSGLEFLTQRTSILSSNTFTVNLLSPKTFENPALTSNDITCSYSPNHGITEVLDYNLVNYFTSSTVTTPLTTPATLTPRNVFINNLRKDYLYDSNHHLLYLITANNTSIFDWTCYNSKFNYILQDDFYYAYKPSTITSENMFTL